MSFFEDLWKKFAQQPSSAAPVKHQGEPSATQKTNQILQALKDTAKESLEDQTLFNNLKQLQTLLAEPKENNPDQRFTKITEHLGTPESYETIRQERWVPNLHCPNCGSTHIERLPVFPPQSQHNHRYRCISCHLEFNDDTGTPIEVGVPPLNIWMQCWYLMGCTDSLSYIANKLDLELAVVEVMVEQLQKTFSVQKPLTRLLPYEEWSTQAQGLRTQLMNDLATRNERLNANVSTVPKDTTEFRRQQNLRRTLNATPNPSRPTKGPGAGNK